MQAALPEPRRRGFLAALGVPLLTARRVLPGAAPSREAFVEPEPPPELTPVAVPLALTPRAPARPELVIPLAKPAVVPATETPPAIAVVAAVSKPLAAPSFSCRLLQVAPTLAVLLDLGAYPDLTPAARQLWQGICQAFGWQAQPLGADFTWPLLPVAGARALLDAGPEAARAVLKGRLERDLQPGMRLLVLGEAVAAHVEPPHLQLPALDALLASPLAKRALWRQLAVEA